MNALPSTHPRGKEAYSCKWSQHSLHPSWNCHQPSTNQLPLAEPSPGSAGMGLPGQRMGGAGQTSGPQAGRHNHWVPSVCEQRPVIPLGRRMELLFPLFVKWLSMVACIFQKRPQYFLFPHALQELCHSPSPRGGVYLASPWVSVQVLEPMWVLSPLVSSSIT